MGIKKVHNKMNTEDFIKKANLIHNNLYLYDKVNYENSKTKVLIGCKKHGYFLQIPNDHLSSKSGCKKCHIERLYNNEHKKKTSYEDFIKKANLIHNKFYNYEKSILNGQKNKIIIICPKHGDFTQRVSAHLSGQGCPYCALDKKRNNPETQEKAIKNSFRRKDFILPSGRRITLQGSEPQVLNDLLKIYNENDIIFSKKDMPKINYIDKLGKYRRYYPDFYIPFKNLIIEVKSSFTYYIDRENINAKINSTKALGFDFKLIINDKRSKYLNMENFNE